MRKVHPPCIWRANTASYFFVHRSSLPFPEPESYEVCIDPFHPIFLWLFFINNVLQYSQISHWQYSHFVLLSPGELRHCDLSCPKFYILLFLFPSFSSLSVFVLNISYHFPIIFFHVNLLPPFFFPLIIQSLFDLSLHIPFRHFWPSWCVTCWMRAILALEMGTVVRRPSSMGRESVLPATLRLRPSSSPMSCSRAYMSTGPLPATRRWGRRGKRGYITCRCLCGQIENALGNIYISLTYHRSLASKPTK